MAGRRILHLLGIRASQNICLHHSEFNCLPILRLEIHIERQRHSRLTFINDVRYWLGRYLDADVNPHHGR